MMQDINNPNVFCNDRSPSHTRKKKTPKKPKKPNPHKQKKPSPKPPVELF